MIKEAIADQFRQLQDEICSGLEAEDGLGHFQEDQWTRPGGGGGRTRIFQYGEIIEKGGVNFSSVHGKTPKRILKALKLGDADFFATGLSIVLHPFNPFVPIIHMNIRYFEMTDGTWWFGGGIDLTPHYVDEEDAKLFHQKLKSVCDTGHQEFYRKFKTWADDYFFLRHRNETRGIGGIFFDRLNDQIGMDRSAVMKFVMDVGHAFMPVYRNLVRRNCEKPFNEQHKSWQQLRRGRYVEFNLIYDIGTKFGLDTDGRTESILMSLPPTASWDYNIIPEKGSAEAHTLSLLKKNIDWINYKYAADIR